jgi:hypothetical protein
VQAVAKETVFKHHGYTCKLVQPAPQPSTWYIKVLYVGEWRDAEEVTSMRETYRAELKERLEQCDKCRVGQSAFCSHTPCNCDCHANSHHYKERRATEKALAEKARAEVEPEAEEPPRIPEVSREQFWAGVVNCSAAMDGGRRPLIVPPELVDDLQEAILELSHVFVHEDMLADHTDCRFCGAKVDNVWDSGDIEHKPDCIGQKLLTLIRNR